MKIITAISIFLISCFTVFSQDESVIKNIDVKLKNGETTISEVLGNEGLMHLHTVTEFRNMIKKHAKAGPLSIVTHRKEGQRISVYGKVKNRSGIAQRNILVYVYQTSDKGWYAQSSPHITGNEGDYGHARLFGYMKTGNDGEFSFETIKPGGYPDSDLPAHIHIQLWTEKGEPLHAAGELLFDDDSRLTPERRKRSEREGFLIARSSGPLNHPVFEYIIIAD